MSLTLTDRLAKQLSLVEQRKADLADVDALLERCMAERAGTERNKQEAVAQREKGEALFKELEAQDNAIRKEAADIASQNEQDRTTMMRDMEAMVERVNARVNAESEREAKVKYRNEKLKEHITLVQNHLNQGSDKIQSLIEMREKDVSGVETHLKNEEELQAVLAEKVALQKARIDEALVVHTKLKTEADGHVARFARIQASLKAARAAFDDGQAHKEALQRKLITAQAERKQTQLRADRAHKDHDTELEHALKLEKQLATLDAQISKLKSLTEGLTAEKAAE